MRNIPLINIKTFTNNSNSNLKQNDLMLNYFADGFEQLSLIQQHNNVQQILQITTLDLSKNESSRMPNLTQTLAIFFNQLKVLDLSYNCIKRIQGQTLIQACPNLQQFIIANNQISILDEFLPLGKLKNLQLLNFTGNPLESLKKPFIILQTLLLDGVLDHYQKNKLQILSMTGANTMKMQLSEKEYQQMMKAKDIKVPRNNENFKNLVHLNGNKPTTKPSYHQKAHSFSYSSKPPKPNSQNITMEINTRNEKVIKTKINENKEIIKNRNLQKRQRLTFSTFEAASLIYPRLKKQVKKTNNKTQEEILEGIKLKESIQNEEAYNIVLKSEHKELKLQMSTQNIKLQNAIEKAKDFHKQTMRFSKSESKIKKPDVPKIEDLDMRTNITIKADDMKNVELGENDKVNMNKRLITKISQSDSRVLKRKQMYKTQIKQHEKMMSQIRKKESSDFALSEESSYLEEHDSDYIRQQKQKSDSSMDESDQSTIFHMIHKPNLRSRKVSRFRTESRTIENSQSHKKRKIKKEKEQPFDDLELIDQGKLDSQGFNTPTNKQAPTASTAFTQSFVRSKHNRTKTTNFINQTPFSVNTSIDQNDQSQTVQRTLHKKSVSTSLNQTTKPAVINLNLKNFLKDKIISTSLQAFKNRQLILLKNIKFAKDREQQCAINRQEFNKNADLICKLIEQKREGPEAIKSLIKKNLFNTEIIDPKTKMRMIECMVGSSVPQSIQDAEHIANVEQVLLEKIREADPKLLGSDFQTLEVDEIRQIYFTVLQDQYSKQDLQKLRNSLKQLYSRTKKILSERKVRDLIDKEKHTLPLERIQYLERYLDLTSELNQYPTRNETKEDWQKKLMMKNEWELRRKTYSQSQAQSKMRSEQKLKLIREKKLIQREFLKYSIVLLSSFTQSREKNKQVNLKSNINKHQRRPRQQRYGEFVVGKVGVQIS
eukprot:403350584